MSEPGKLETIRFLPEALAVAKRIQKLSGASSVEEVVQLALGNELYLREKIKAGFRQDIQTCFNTSVIAPHATKVITATITTEQAPLMAGQSRKG